MFVRLCGDRLIPPKPLWFHLERRVKDNAPYQEHVCRITEVAGHMISGERRHRVCRPTSEDS